jgi:hypothetical protein
MRPTTRSTTTTLTAGAALATGLVLLGASASARAGTLWIEAESVRDEPLRGTITSPLQIKESSAASNGGFIEVQSGKDSKTSMPTLGRVCYRFTADVEGSYRIWARVIAANDGDDSFWVQMDGGTPVNWQVALGSGWHWDQVHKTGTSTPSLFALTAADHDVCFGYREDGTKLDLMVITDDATFDPTAPHPGAPAIPPGIQAVGAPGQVLVSWTFALGAQSYWVQRRTGFVDPFETVATVAGTQFTFLDTPPPIADETFCYQVVAVTPVGWSGPTAEWCTSARFDSIVAEAESFSLTSPLKVGENPGGFSVIEVQAGNNSKSSPPSTGWARFDFRQAVARTVKVWAVVTAATNGDDSYWVRMDFGSWIKWNDWKILYGEACEWEDVHNSDTDSKPVLYNLGAGNHTIEFAYREDGAQLDKILITDDLSTTKPGGCFD